MTVDSKTQMDIDECLIENARAEALDKDGHPYLGDVNWPKMVLDMIRIIERLKVEKGELLEAVHRQNK